MWIDLLPKHLIEKRIRRHSILLDTYVAAQRFSKMLLASHMCMASPATSARREAGTVMEERKYHYIFASRGPVDTIPTLINNCDSMLSCVESKGGKLPCMKFSKHHTKRCYSKQINIDVERCHPFQIFRSRSTTLFRKRSTRMTSNRRISDTSITVEHETFVLIVISLLTAMKNSDTTQ